MKRHIKRATVQATGVAFVLFGTAGLFLPILQGVLFLIVGFLLLSVYSPSLKSRITQVAERYPKFRDIILKAERVVLRLVGEQ